VTVGASGGVFAILMAFGLVFGENEIMMIPFPFLIKAKYFVLILIVVTVAFCHQRRRKHGVPGAPGWFALWISVREVRTRARSVWKIFQSRSGITD